MTAHLALVGRRTACFVEVEHVQGPPPIFADMTRGRSWSKTDADRWVERWWASGLTSRSFVENEQLPISARSLRQHGVRRFRDVLQELWDLRRSAMAAAPLDCESAGGATGANAVGGDAPRHLASAAAMPPTPQPSLSPNEDPPMESPRRPTKGFFDFED